MVFTHTPGPWAVQGDTDVIGERGEFVATTHYPESAIGTAVEYANAARIVACVNACEGYSTAVLKSYVKGGGLLSAAKNLAAQRDELAAALRGAEQLALALGSLVRELDENADHSECWTQDGDYIALPQFKAIRAALAKVTP